MKIIAAIMDVTTLRFFRHGYIARRTKRYLVYDPSKVTGWDIERKAKDGRTV